MTTCSTIVARALGRIRITGAGETASAEDASLALDLLNAMLLRWPSRGVDAKWSTKVLADTFYFFVPPAAADGGVIAALTDQGTWDADANSPALADGSGTLGDYYRVTTAGTTDLDDIAGWAVNDFAVFDGDVWLQSVNSSRFEQAVIDLLAMEASVDFGKEPAPMLVRSADAGWRQIQAAFIKPQAADFDAGLIHTYARPWTGGVDN